ncbi:MAG: glycosyltransferase family 4 protein [bacterium]
MKVLLLNTTDSGGGAAIATRRLHEGLINSGVESKILVQRKLSKDPNVIGPNSLFSRSYTKIHNIIDNAPLYLYKERESGLFSVSRLSSNTTIKIRKINPDIIHLHWINNGFLSVKDITSLNQLKKPIVWTLHDMWPFTGGCHYSGNCTKYKSNCGNCPKLASNTERDLSFKSFNKKIEGFKDLKIHIVVLSKWMKKCVEESYIFRDNNVSLIPNGIDTNIYQPRDKNKARNNLGLAKNKFVILFGAAKVSEKRKGFKYLINALSILKEDKNINDNKISILIFGNANNIDLNNLPFETILLGKINDKNKIIDAYNAANVFVLPALQDNLPNTLLESFACGTPAVSFSTSGIKDIIDHKNNGYLAFYKDVHDLTEGIKWIIENKERNNILGRSARRKSLEVYKSEIQVEKFKELYQKVIYENNKYY